MTQSHRVKDALLIETEALPNGASSTQTDGFDLGPLTQNGARLEEIEAEVIAPALTTADLGDAATMTYSIETDATSTFGSPTVLNSALIVQTGAGGAGAAAASARFKIPSDCERYIRAKATNSAAGDASDKSLTFQLLF